MQQQLLNCASLQLPKLIKEKYISLVIIDSVASVFRTENGIQKTRNLQKFGFQLFELARLNNIAILAVNQVSSLMLSMKIFFNFI